MWRVLVIVLLMAAVAPAWAQPTDPPSQNALAIEKARQARELFDASKWQESYALFQEADKLYHSPVLVLYAARSLRNLDRLLEARALYQSLTAEALPAGAAAAWKEAQADGAGELAALADDVPRVSFVVAGATADTQLTVDDQATALDTAIEIDPGSHHVVVSHEGHVTHDISVTIARGARDPIRFGIAKPAPDPVPPPLPPPLPFPQPPPPGEEESLNVPALVLTIAGGAVLTAGAILGVAALVEKNSADDALPASCTAERVCPAFEEARIDESYDTAVTLAGVSDGLLIGGAVLAAAGIVLWILDPFGSDAQSASHDPFVVRF